MSGIETVSIPAAFVFGLISFFSPCVLPLVPAYLSYISGVSVEELEADRSRKAVVRTFGRSAVFVLGFSLVFIALGATATSVGQLLNERLDILMKVGGVILVIFGLHMIGVFRIRTLYAEKRFHVRLRKIGYAGAFLVGVAFAFGWTPCIGPALATILTLAADSGTMSRGMGLLAVYSLGLGIPFLAVGLATGSVLRAFSRLKRHFRKIEIASGALIILVGVVVFFGGFGILSNLL